MDDNKRTTKIPSSSFVRVVHAFVHSNLTLQHVTGVLFLKFTDRFKQSNADSYCRSDVAFDLKTACMCLKGSITMHHSLLAGKQN